MFKKRAAQPGYLTLITVSFGADLVIPTELWFAPDVTDWKMFPQYELQSTQMKDLNER